MVNVRGGGVTEDASFGTHEFLDFCELIGAEPYICLNVGSGTVQEASEWVEYVTSSNISPMTDLHFSADGQQIGITQGWCGIGHPLQSEPE